MTITLHISSLNILSVYIFIGENYELLAFMEDLDAKGLLTDGKYFVVAVFFEAFELEYPELLINGTSRYSCGHSRRSCTIVRFSLAKVQRIYSLISGVHRVF